MANNVTDAHRRFLQLLMSHGIMEGSEARKLHRHCCEKHKVYYAHDKLDDFIGIINSLLQPLFMEIRKGMSEEEGKPYYALVNLTETEITKMATDYAENELELFKKTMDLIIISENGFAPSMSILNLSDQLQTKKMKKKEVEQLLHNFVRDKWLSECQTCETCATAMHLPCAARYFRAQAEPHCPFCSEFWPHEILEINQPDSQLPCTSKGERRRDSSSGKRRH
ncbi:non-structural maintenance of chromosomes element 1 homolog isoform X3 [Ornithorhynchus anatinus]|uniref:non-structural maintenance of chromosomes element 1 homolog isoform X3 n=1 Tax=Ornithorhynchus anatinus TaxID=9258 RepID=UPI0010A7E96E|nr:non-structural maintenance of chromosomes element 1 homolog isoform X3 [Ornithorhynchus anatinus]